MRRILVVSALLFFTCGILLSCDNIDSQDSAIVSDSGTAGDSGSEVNDAGGAQSGSAATIMSAADQKAFFKTYVSLGDSLTQGCQGINVEENRQYYSYPAQLARAMGTSFNQPLIEYPGVGIPNPEDGFKNGWFDTWSSTISHMIKTMLYWHRVDRYRDQANINNFGISGATIDDIISYDGTKKITELTDSMLMSMVGLMNPWICSVVGLSPAKAKSALDQALDRDPTFVSLWIGNNDIIFGTTMTVVSKNIMTDLDKWEANWNIIVARIKAKKSVKGVLLINLPDNTDIPYLQPYNNKYCTVAEGADIPAGSRTPFFYTKVNDIDDVITPDEIKTIQERIVAINEIINATAKSEGWALLDVYTLLKNEIGGMYLVGPDGNKSGVEITGEYMGGFFSLDGTHPSSAGYAVVAGRAAKAINEKYGTSIPAIDEVAVWKKDTLCQNPIDPREYPVQMGNMTYLFKTQISLMAQML